MGLILGKKKKVDVEDELHSQPKIKDKGLWRDLTAYWILGLCNNYGYVVMLSAAHDILKRFEVDDTTDPDPDSDPDVDSTQRLCNIISTGAILLADIIPSLCIKLLGPFLPFYINIRILLACLLQAGGFLLIAYATDQWMAILGVVCTSLSSGLGETSFLSYSSKFNKNVVSTWSSGTGGAGIAGSLSYAGLIALGVNEQTTILIMLVVPVIESIAFWIILRKPVINNSSTKQIESVTDTTNQNSTETITTNTNDGNATYVRSISDSVAIDATEGYRSSAYLDDIDAETKALKGFRQQIAYIPKLFKYMIPLTLVYLFEYFINQGLFELVYFKDIWIDHQTQYRWLQVDYQIGVFISRSSVNLFTIDKLWLMAVLQFINVIYFIFEVLFFFSPSIWLIFAIVFWEGLLGGGAYVNTFYKISKDVPLARRKFAMGIVTMSDSLGIALAGVFSIPTHNAICPLPMPVRM